ncbi:phosphoenolpyruvate phosphomutase-domain-containing protein [Polychytrium aggregatum]|uniref:phosphoenolpyruvate phosphomutase-domain-containing protein n=1 Tax=Polychytrium aggregatum TaxID=110093 RepID=UPI0022FEF019|nr:phosphoenolpyruvate phosphomutase-domain-containing protein [Polychytrium aggregatum]KAI9206751.1 phosphoenolpyruvate phosphomutase-domain-containing protein [Polychytrium aggregatum]
MTSSLNALARQLAQLHQSGNPVVLANVYDAITANALLATPGVKAAATASFAIAASIGIRDDDLTLEDNLRSIGVVSRALAGKIPLSADLQDGYGPRLEETIRSAIGLGVVGCNIEDVYPNSRNLYDLEEAAERVRQVRRVATECGVPDFVINARTDALRLGHPREEAIRRGQAYLKAGADAVFVWAYRKFDHDELRELSKAFEGRLSVKLGDPGETMSVQEMADLGVCRVSVGPSMMRKCVETFQKVAGELFAGGRL